MQSGWIPRELVLPPNEVVSAAQLHLLVVENDEPLWVCERLQSLGFSVHVLRSGSEVLEFIAQMKKISGVLLDMQTLTTDGINVLSQLRDRYPQVPIITMSDVKDIGLLRKSIELGASEYLVRPIDQQVLKIKCANVFFHRGRLGLPKNGQR